MSIPFYSNITQKIANGFPNWMKFRSDRVTVGQELFNPFGIELQNIIRSFNAALRGLFLSEADINIIDILQKVQLPVATIINEDNPPTVIGDGLGVILEDDLDTFYYGLPPTRISRIGSFSTPAPGIVFDDQLSYDIPFTDNNNNEFQMFFEYDLPTGRLIKYHLVDDIIERPLDQLTPNPSKEILGSYGLLDTNNAAITGNYIGACLNLDRMLILFDTTLYIFDVRSPLLLTTDPNWAPNAEQPNLIAMAQFTISDTISNTPAGMVFDENTNYFWIRNGIGEFLQYKLLFDYAIFDFKTKRLFLKEKYTILTVGGEPYTSTYHRIWNYFDEFGLLLNTPRLEGEINSDYQARMLRVMKFRANSTAQGIVNGITNELDLDYYGYWEQGTYPKQLYPGGFFPSGYPIYASGVYPVGSGNLVKLWALNDGVFLSGVIDPATNIPSFEFVDYTKEILSTFPVVWGSGNGDLTGFIWDLAPFDGGLNYSAAVPDYFALLGSGVDPAYYQSGIRF